MLKISPKTPFDPAKWPFFYGWIILICGPLGMLMSIPGQTMGVSVFTDALIEALRLSRDELSLAYMLGTIGSSFLLPWAGKKYDQWGARVLAILSSMGMGLVLLYLSVLPRFIDWLVVDRTIIVIAFTTTGFLLLRFFGQGVLTMTSRNMMMEWFERRRGLATGLSNSVVSFGFSVAPLVLYYLIERSAWSGAWQILALVACVIFPVFAFTFFRDNPEASDLKPDGNYQGRRRAEPKALFPVVKQYSKKEAIRNYAFWVFALMVSMHGLFITGFTFHVVSLFGEAGIDAERAISVFPQSAVIAIAVTLLASITSDHIQLKLLLYAMGISVCVWVLGIILLGHFTGAFFLIVVGSGMASGLFSVLMSVTWPRYFGRLHLGAISGQVLSMTVFFSALGPIMFSLSLTYFGSYRMAGWICLAIFLLLTLAAVRANNPQIRHREELTTND